METITEDSVRFSGNYKQSRFLIVICLMFGFDISNSAPSWRPRFLRWLSIVLYGLSLYPTVASTIARMSRGMSLGRLAAVVHLCSSTVIMALIIRMLHFKRAILLTLFEGRPKRPWAERFIIILLRLPVIVYIALRTFEVAWDGRWLLAVNYVAHTYRLLSGILPLLIYLEILTILENWALSLVTSVETRYARLDHLAKKKWFIRDKVDDLNTLFSFLLIAIHLQFSAEVVLGTGSLVLMDQSVIASFTSMGQLGTLPIIYILVCRSEKLINALIEVERVAFRRLGEVSGFNGTLHIISSSHNSPAIQWQVLRFDSNLDAPTVGCFVLCQETFMGFLLTGLTCLAVVMQFDFKVVWAIQTLAERYGHINSDD